ncbi:hypothetical protein XhyaCFBP1156_20995 [Xanthomonas hyacinthi]|uniref:Uncharacterized protein n=1 Tax=Xanthomonas hyacinthi TaxID=56455 RepID=A0A2S7EN60_9XANT|nr:hypothetical protein XhyaCFBP1156_20995 [Xanthomonas hyacinthi]
MQVRPEISIRSRIGTCGCCSLGLRIGSQLAQKLCRLNLDSLRICLAIIIREILREQRIRPVISHDLRYLHTCAKCILGALIHIAFVVLNLLLELCDSCLLIRINGAMRSCIFQN